LNAPLREETAADRGMAGPMRTKEPVKPEVSNRSHSESAARPRTGKLVYYHANGQGTGTAVRFELRLNQPQEDRYDCFFLEMARQKPFAQDGTHRGPAMFDWENKVAVKLGFMDVCEFLAVLEGKRERMGDSRGALYHETAASSTLITMERSQKQNGFFLGVSRKGKESGQPLKGHILLNDVEAIGLRCAFQSALFFMAFSRSLPWLDAPLAGSRSGVPDCSYR
jgi:hypothetical protein